MENQDEKFTPKSHEDRGALWAILLTLGMILIMVILKQFIA